MRFFWLSRQSAPLTVRNLAMGTDRYGFAVTMSMIVAILVCLLTTSTADSLHRYATVTALAVGIINGTPIGGVHYIAIQLDYDPQGQGPRILFSERRRGSIVGDGWKEGVRVATVAASYAMEQDARYWTVTIQNRTNHSLTDGSSASAAIAVGIMAAWRGDTVRSDVVLTGAIRPNGDIGRVDGLLSKLDGAARAHLHMLLVPKGQARTPEWDLIEQGSQQNITVVEVGSLAEAYERMTIP